MLRGAVERRAQGGEYIIANPALDLAQMSNEYRALVFSNLYNDPMNLFFETFQRANK